MTLALPQNEDAFSPAPVSTPTPARTPFSAAAPGKSTQPDIQYLAHDARNWLTVLKVYCDLLRTSGAVASGYEKWMEELSSAVERGHKLVASLVDSVERADPSFELASVPAAGQAAIFGDRQPPAGIPHTPLSLGWGNNSAVLAAASAPSSLNLADAIGRRLPLFERLAGSEIHVEVDAPGNASQVAMPESAFERILQNLVSNAIESMPHGGHLRIALRRGNRNSAPKSKRPSKRTVLKTLLLRVSDTGDGIAPEKLPYIFEAGVSSKSERAGDAPARGFGLAIVRELTERAGGTVRVRSHRGRGSCFEIELPRI